MMRGARVQVPPLHNVADVVGLLLLLVLLFLLMRWILGGGSPWQELAGWFNPPPMATLLVISIGLAEAVPEIAALLPVREKGSRSAALVVAQRIGGALLETRQYWRAGSLRAVRLKETGAVEAWEAAWQHAQRGPDEGSAGPLRMTVVTILALIDGRALRIPPHVTADEIARFVKGLGVLDVQRLEAIGALAATVPAQPAGAPALGLVAL